MKNLKNLGKREKVLLGVVIGGLLGVGGLLLFGGKPQDTPALPPPAMPTAQAPPIQEPPPLPEREQEKPQTEPQPQTQTQTQKEDKFIDLLFLEYAKKSQRETSRETPQLPPIPPFREVPVMPLGERPEVLERPKVVEPVQVKIYGITCQETCQAITNLGVLKVGDRIGGERVLAIDKTGIRTDKRFISF